MPASLQLTHREVGEQSLGLCWAAILDDQVVGLIAKSTPKNKKVDKKEYQHKAISCLSMLGEVKSGDFLVIDGTKYFAKKLAHRLRVSEEHDQTRIRQLYHIAPWVLSGFGSPRPARVEKECVNHA